MNWRDFRFEQPPSGERVLVVTYYREVEFATWNESASRSKGWLPGSVLAVWCRNSVEGREHIFWWQPVPEAPLGPSKDYP